MIGIAFELTTICAVISLFALFVNAASVWRASDLSPEAFVAFWRGVFWSLTRAGFASFAGVFRNAHKKP